MTQYRMGPRDVVTPAPEPAPQARPGDVLVDVDTENEKVDWGVVVAVPTPARRYAWLELDVLMATRQGEVLAPGKRRVERVRVWTLGSVIPAALLAEVCTDAAGRSALD